MTGDPLAKLPSPSSNNSHVADVDLRQRAQSVVFLISPDRHDVQPFPGFASKKSRVEEMMRRHVDVDM
jgi:hypothetical protein